jgi:hypothetical protein
MPNHGIIYKMKEYATATPQNPTSLGRQARTRLLRRGRVPSSTGRGGGTVAGRHRNRRNSEDRRESSTSSGGGPPTVARRTSRRPNARLWLARQVIPERQGLTLTVSVVLPRMKQFLPPTYCSSRKCVVIASFHAQLPCSQDGRSARTPRNTQIKVSSGRAL